MVVDDAYKHIGRCVFCGYRVDRASATPDEKDPRPPQAGDFTMCIECGNFSVVGDVGELRKPNPQEQAEIAGSMQCLKMRACWILTKEHFRRKRGTH